VHLKHLGDRAEPFRHRVVPPACRISIVMNAVTS